MWRAASNARTEGPRMTTSRIAGITRGDNMPNVLFVVLDTARADALEPFGAKPGSSPAIAQLAAEGQVAPYTVAPSNWTVPSHASMFTGVLPRDVGLAQAPGNHPSECRPLIEAVEDRLLPTVLRAHGYRTAGVSTNLWVSPDTGFDLGFDRFDMVT